jgi:hypothetical protein
MPRRDPRVRAVCGLAPASEPFVGRKAFEPDELPFEGERPTLIVAAIDDVLVDLETSVRPLFDRLRSPRALVGVRDSDHFHFCDGIELLHGLHENNPRENQPRPTRPFAQLQSEDRTHRSLRALVTFFFSEALADTGDPLEAASPEALAELDPSLVRLD